MSVLCAIDWGRSVGDYHYSWYFIFQFNGFGAAHKSKAVKRRRGKLAHESSSLLFLSILRMPSYSILTLLFFIPTHPALVLTTVLHLCCSLPPITSFNTVISFVWLMKTPMKKAAKQLSQYREIYQRKWWALKLILPEVQLKSHSLWGICPESGALPYVLWRQSYSLQAVLSCVTIYIPQHSINLGVQWLEVYFSSLLDREALIANAVTFILVSWA